MFSWQTLKSVWSSKMQLSFAAGAGLILGFVCGIATAQTQRANSEFGAWFPLQIGNSWTYAIESRDGTQGGIANPVVSRWQVVETIRSIVDTPDGSIIERVTEATPKQARYGVSHLLLRDGCLYRLDGAGALEQFHALDSNGKITEEFRGLLASGKVSPDLCFPLTDGRTWGNPNDIAWRVLGSAKEPGHPKVFHIGAYLGSGSTVEIWFEKGRGIVRQRELHHGTYWETREQLVRFEPRANH
jgi:hypothetical protein